MAAYTLENIARDVRIAIDQNMVSTALEIIGDVDTLAVNDIIKSKVCEAVKRVHGTAPVYLLDGGSNFSGNVNWKSQGSGWILLPNDFMRLIVFQMSDWDKPVYEAKEPAGQDYDRQASRFKGIRGTAQKPECFIGVSSNSKILEFYSCDNNSATVSRAIYLPYPTIGVNENINICIRCYESVIYMVASVVMSTFGDNAKAGVFAELSRTALI